jgi:glycyl-tRNA synthetase
MVVEMTSLQGIMGGHYARLAKEPDAVAEAIAEQYNAVSVTKPGLALALADRLDSLIGLFAAGLAPKGSNDPYALRRAAIQIIENLVGNQVPFDLRQAVINAAPLLPIPAGEETVEDVLVFVKNRLENYLVEKGIRTSVVRAVLAAQGHDPYSADRAATELDEQVTKPDWPTLLDAYARCARISRDQPEGEVRADALRLAEEKELLAAIRRAEARLDGTIPTFVGALSDAEPAITAFFDSVLVMDDDEAIRLNRVALVQRVVLLADGLVDLSYLEGF